LTINVNQCRTISIHAHNATINDVNHLVLGTVVMSGALQVTVVGDLSMSASGVLQVDGHSSLSAGGSISLGDVTIGQASMAANLSLQAGGGISQATGKQLTVYGSASLSAGLAGIVLANASNVTGLNDFVGLVTVASAGVATLRDSNTLTLAGSASGAMTLTAAGAIGMGTVTVGTTTAAANLDLSSGAGLAQSSGAALTVYGSSSFSAVGDVVLANLSGSTALNDFVGRVNITAARDVQLADKNALDLETQTVRTVDVAAAGALGLGPVTATGTLSASGALTLTGDLSAQSISLISSAALNMAGYTVTANAATGSVLMRAQGDITLARVRAVNGDVTVDSTGGNDHCDDNGASANCGDVRVCQSFCYDHSWCVLKSACKVWPARWPCLVLPL
jgi:hypothetical protein